MRSLRAALMRLRDMFWPRGRERDLADELESHLQLDIDEGIRAGLSHAEARRRAVVALGGLQQTTERVRERAGLPQLEAILYDIRHACRALARRKVLVIAATLSIAFGVGVNLAAYSLLRGLLFSGWVVGVPDPERLVTIGPGLSYPNYRDLQMRELPVETAALQASTLIWRADSNTTVAGRVVSENFFDVLRVRPVLGHTFLGARDTGVDRVIVSFEFWRRRLLADPAAVGRVLELNGWPHTIVGVLPREFKAQVGPMVSASVYLPITPHAARALEDRAAAQFDVVGRLAPGATREQAYAALRSAVERLESEFPAANDGIAGHIRVFEGSLGPVQAMLTQAGQGTTALTLAGAGYGLITLVLVIACANVAGLLAARADERRHETAIRVALGAGRRRLVQQALAESVIIAALGCGTGAALLAITVRLFATSSLIVGAGLELVPVPVPLAMTSVLVVAVTLACGLAPSLAAIRVGPLAGLKANHLGHTVKRFHLHRMLVASQVTVSVVVLSTAFLLAHTYMLLTAVTPGYDTVHTAGISARVPLTPGGATLGDVKAALEREPGVEAVSYGALPLGILPRSATVRRVGGEDRLDIELQPVGPGYLTTMKIPIVSGRDLHADDLKRVAGNAVPVVVNQAFARRYFAATPLDQHVVLERDRENGRPDRRLRVVGVARDTKTRGLNDDNLPVVYMPVISNMSLVVRLSGPSTASIAALSGAAARALPGAAISVTPMASQLTYALLPSRIAAILLTSLGGIGLLLAMTGLFGIISSETSRRRFEIGIRIALGATRAAVVWLVLRGALGLVGAGAIAGFALAAFGGRALYPLLAPGQPASDPVAGVMVLLTLVVVAGIASLRPVRKATKVEPVIALRSE
jgi:predicted permease